MRSSFCSRLPFAKLAAAALLVAQWPGGVTFARAGGAPAPAVSPPEAPPPAVTAMRRSLREFDRFLDHHPLLEDQLRLNPARARDRVFRENHPELHDFLTANPDVIPGLRHYPRYFLYRALLRQANAPLRYAEIAALGLVFDQQPDLERALTRDPESIRDPVFLRAHAPLRDFLEQHPGLGQVFFPHDKPLAKNS